MIIQQIKEPKIKVSPTLRYALWTLAHQHKLSWSECVELGVLIKLAEKGVVPYPNTTFKVKYNKMRELYEDLLKQTDKGTKKNDLSNKKQKPNGKKR